MIGEQPTRFFHTGSNPGYQCELHAYIHEGKGAIVMTNADQGWRLGREILWSIAREYDWQEYGYGPEVKKVAQLSPDEFSQYIGDYRIHSAKTAGKVIRVSSDGGRLFIHHSDYPREVELCAGMDGQFFTIEDAINLRFVQDAAGNVSGLIGDQVWRAEREPGR